MIIISALRQCNNYNKKYGMVKAIKLFYFLYYGKIKKLNLKQRNIITTKTGYKLLIIPGDDGISQELAIYGTHEPMTTQIINEIIKKDFVCVDIGANIGYYASLESNTVDKVIAIEPSPLAFQYLEKNLKLQNKSNYEVYNYGCSNENAVLNFLVSEKSNISKIIEKSDIKDGMNTIKISVKTLDTILLKEKRVDFIRMDIEGHELKAIEGSKETIKKFKPIIQIELHSKLLGINDTRKILEFFKNEHYNIAAYMNRELDLAIIGSYDDIKNNYTLEDLISMLENNTLPAFLQLTLIYDALKN